MSSKDLQRVTESVSYIGQAPLHHYFLAAHRYHVTGKVNASNRPSVYLIPWHCLRD
jgi:hypothetical protein